MDRRWLLATAVALTAVLAGMWWGRGLRPQPAAAPLTLAPAGSSAPTTVPILLVHVSGWVVAPGLVSVEQGSRVGDALAAAGGVLPGARLEAMNLAGVVGDGEQVVVPGPGDSTSGEAFDPEPEVDDGLVHLNSATASELETLPGVGPVLAERIVSHRDSRGDFQQVEDLLDVSGIGEAKLSSIRDLVAVP